MQALFSLVEDFGMKRNISVFLALAVLCSLTSCGLFRPAGDWVEPPNGDTEQRVTDTTEQTPEPTESEAPPAPVYEPARVSFIGCGDNIIYYGNVREAAGKATSGRKYGFAYSYEHVAPLISGADVAFINQETLMCGDGYELSYYPHFNSPREVGLDLVDIGFDVVNIANNHMLDKTGDGLEKTIEFWKEQPVLMIGGYDSEEDYNTPRFLESGGLKLGFLSYTAHTNGLTIGKSYSAWIPYLNEKYVSDEEIKAHIAAAREQSDVLIVSVHWGEEGSFTPSDEQRRYASLFADAGVDVIIGHHPHVIQPVEWLDGADGGKTLCVYSLGNFMAEQAADYNMVGGMISFELVRSTDGTVSVESPLFIPTVFHFNKSFYNNQVWLMEDYTADMALSHGISYYGNRTTLDKLIKYVTSTVSSEFLPEFLK